MGPGTRVTAHCAVSRPGGGRVTAHCAVSRPGGGRVTAQCAVTRPAVCIKLPRESGREHQPAGDHRCRQHGPHKAERFFVNPLGGLIGHPDTQARRPPRPRTGALRRTQPPQGLTHLANARGPGLRQKRAHICRFTGPLRAMVICLHQSTAPLSRSSIPSGNRKRCRHLLPHALGSPFPASPRASAPPKRRRARV